MYARAVLLIIAALVILVAPAGADSEGDAFVTKSAPAAVTAGDTITYTITVGSNGPGPAVDVELKDPVPAGTTPVSAAPESQCDEVESDTEVFECDLGTVGEEDPETVTLVVQTSESTPSSVTNVATITSGEGSDEPNNEASVTTEVVEPSPPPPPPPSPEPPPAPPPPTPPPPGPPPGPEADLVLTKQDAPDPVGAGGALTYLLTVTNAGPDAATGVGLVDDLPFSTTLISASPSQGFCSGTDPVSCELGSIASSASATVTLVVKVGQPGFVFNTAAVFASFPSDPVPANNGTAASTTVVSSSSPPPPPSPPTPPVPPSPPVTPPAPPPPPTTTLAAAPDVVPPREVAGVRATVGSRSVVVRWRTPSDPDFLRVEMTRSSRGERERVVYSGSGETFTDRSLRNGVRYVYRLRSFDRAGNASTGVQFAATPKALLLFSPPPNARVSSPPLLRWVAVRGARYYNVQLYRGKTKVLSTWPRANRLQLRGRWTFRGRSQRLVPGVYHWFVWSGRGSRARPSYGPLLGQNSFVVEVRVR